MGILAIILILAVKIWPGINAKAEDNEIATDYPESLLELMEHNPETRDFVLGYFQNKDKAVEIDISGEVHKGTIPLFLQWDERWGYEKYGADFMAVTGCGPTCLSMVQCGLSGETKWNPLEVANMAQKQGFYVEGAGSSWDLMTTGAEQIGLYEHEVVYDEAHIISELESGNPIICIMGPGDFTSSGHFIVLAGVDEYGKIIVCDPNSRINSEKHWEVGEIIGQIRNLWGYTYS
ncbi:MAG: C39 family peptidase [Lachnospiraceae bacterium]|nr:C39 family peptidase [Lachnospiraceae bacterium]